MRFLAIRLRHVRRFGAQGLRLEGFSPGLNVLARPNEFGKSTVLDAVKAALFVKASSKRPEVRSLTPLGTEEMPYVELDVETGEGSFRIRKCFGAGKRATLHRIETIEGSEVARDGEAEQWITAQIAATAGEGLPGMLWLGQGAGLSLEPTAANRETALAMLSDAVTDVTGGDDARRVVEAASAALGALEDKRGKPRGELKEVLARIDQLQVAIRSSEAALRGTASLRDQVQGLRRKVAALRDPAEDERLARDIETARQDAANAEKAALKRGHTEQALKRAEQDLARANEALLTHEEGVRALKELQSSESMAAEKQAALDLERGHTAAELVRVSDEAEKALQDARTSDALFRRALEKNAAARERANRDALKRALSAGRQLTEDIARLKAVAVRKVPDLDRLSALERAVLKAEAALGTKAPVLVVEAGGNVVLDGVPVAEGASAPITGPGSIKVGRTILRVRQEGAQRAQAEVRTARQNLLHALDEFGCKTIDEARRQEAETREAARDLKAREAELGRLAPDGLAALAERLAAMPADDHADPSDSLSVEDAKSALQAAQGRVDELRQTEQALRVQLAATDKQRADLTVDMEIAKRERRRLEELVGPPESRDRRHEALLAAVEEARDAVGGHRVALDRLEAEAEASALVGDRYERLLEAQKRREHDRGAKAAELAGLEATLTAQLGQGAAEDLEAARQRMEAEERQKERLEGKRRALKLLIGTIADAQARQQTRFLAPVTRHVAPMVQHIYGDASLHFDTELVPEKLERPSGSFHGDALSAGTQEQIALLARFGFAKLAAEQGHAVPLILDDALVYADDDRIERVFDVLRDVASVTQVIVLSCRERVFERLGGHALEPQPFSENS